MSPDSSNASPRGEHESDPSPRLPHDVDPHREQERLLNVSESRAGIYEAQADAARSLRASLDQQEEERRRMGLDGPDLSTLDLPQFALLDLARLVRAGVTMEDLLQRVLEHSVRLFEADKSAILVPNEAGTELVVAAARTLSGQVRDDFSMPVDEGVAGRVFATGERQVVPNTAECEFFKPSGRGDLAPKYLVAVPLTAEGERIGVLCLERPHGMPASYERVELLHAYASHAAHQLRNIQIYQGLMRQVEELSVLCEISRELSSSLQHEALLQKIVDSAVSLLDCRICSLMLFEDDKQHLRIRYAVGLPEEVVEKASAVVGQGVTGWVAERGQPLLIEDITRDERFQARQKGKAKGKYSTRSLLSVPLLIGTEVVGVLNVNNKRNNAVFTHHDLGNLTMLASQAAVSIENARLYETLQRLAVTDPLTKLFRRNYFEEQLTAELGRCRRYGRPLSLMMLDIDHFKSVNDTYGHPVGDQVLQGLAGLLRRYGRKDDLIARYGGEEFVAYLVETDRAGAQLAGERIRSATEVQEFVTTDDRILKVTVSVGTASFPEDSDDPVELVRMADLALYTAKHSGRNQVCGYREGLAMPSAGDGER